MQINHSIARGSPIDDGAALKNYRLASFFPSSAEVQRNFETLHDRHSAPTHSIISFRIGVVLDKSHSGKLVTTTTNENT